MAIPRIISEWIIVFSYARDPTTGCQYIDTLPFSVQSSCSVFTRKYAELYVIFYVYFSNVASHLLGNNMSTTIWLIHPKSYLCTTVNTFVVISSYVAEFAVRLHKQMTARSLHEKLPFWPERDVIGHDLVGYPTWRRLRTCVFPGEFPAQRPVTRSFDVFFDLRLNTRLSKQWWGWWFETPSSPLWRHCNAYLSTCIWFIAASSWFLFLFMNEIITESYIAKLSVYPLQG